MTRRTIGILGGMGPLATVDLYRKVIEATPARTDQEHIPVLIDADPTVPDRTAAILEDGEDPTPWLVRGTDRLVASGAAFIVVPCNTAHAFLDRVRPGCPVPIVSMIEETAREVGRTVEPGASAGILATTGTLAAGLYQSALERAGFTSLTPDDASQSDVLTTIERVKAGQIDEHTADPALSAARGLADRGASILLAACTELPVVLRQDQVSVPLIDPTDVLARAAVRFATDDAAFRNLMQDTEKVRSHAD